MTKQKLYDSKCLDLARHFGTGDPAEALTEKEMEDLASDIQDTVENYFSWWRDRQEHNRVE